MKRIPVLAAAILAGGLLCLLGAAQAAVTVNHAQDAEAKTPQEAVHKVC